MGVRGMDAKLTHTKKITFETMPIAIVCTTTKPAFEFLSMIDPNDRDKFVHVNNLQATQGQHFKAVIRLGLYEPLREQLYDAAMARMPRTTSSMDNMVQKTVR